MKITNDRSPAVEQLFHYSVSEFTWEFVLSSPSIPYSAIRQFLSYTDQGPEHTNYMVTGSYDHPFCGHEMVYLQTVVSHQKM